MNKNLFIALTFLSSIVISSCKKEGTSENTGISISLTTEQKLAHRWKLTGLVNKSDEQKYINGILELKANKTYNNSFASGSITTQGTWTTITDSLFLDSALYNLANGGRYKITLLNTTELHLSEHYTLDNKDAIIEYHYKAN
jgi:hypothetical protein